MQVIKNMDTLVFTPNYFSCFEGNVGDMAVTCKHPHRQRANVSFCFLYNVVPENYSAQNSSCGGWGGGGKGRGVGVYSWPKVYSC